MKHCKILSLVPLLWFIVCCSEKFADVSTIEQEDKTYYKELFTSLPKPFTLEDGNEETVIYKFYSPWCHSCMEELSHLKDVVAKKDKDKSYKVYLFTIEESDKAKERFGFKVHHIKGLFEKTKYQQVPLTFIFKNKTLTGKFTSPMNYSKL